MARYYKDWLLEVKGQVANTNTIVVLTTSVEVEGEQPIEIFIGIPTYKKGFLMGEESSIFSGHMSSFTPEDCNNLYYNWRYHTYRFNGPKYENITLQTFFEDGEVYVKVDVSDLDEPNFKNIEKQLLLTRLDIMFLNKKREEIEIGMSYEF
jgi:hypothetical protein